MPSCFDRPMPTAKFADFAQNWEAKVLSCERFHDIADVPGDHALGFFEKAQSSFCEACDNPLGLYPAYRLYGNPVYERLVDRFGLQKVYILSARWGLIRADFLTPSPSVRVRKDTSAAGRHTLYDFRMLPDHADEEILFFGGKDYLPLFFSLTAAIKTRRTVFYNSVRAPQATGCVFKRFETSTGQLALRMCQHLP
jgi:hypothetical protein